MDDAPTSGGDNPTELCPAGHFQLHELDAHEPNIAKRIAMARRVLGLNPDVDLLDLPVHAERQLKSLEQLEGEDPKLIRRYIGEASLSEVCTGLREKIAELRSRPRSDQELSYVLEALFDASISWSQQNRQKRKGKRLQQADLLGNRLFHRELNYSIAVPSGLSKVTRKLPAAVIFVIADSKLEIEFWPSDPFIAAHSCVLGERDQDLPFHAGKLQARIFYSESEFTALGQSAIAYIQVRPSIFLRARCSAHALLPSKLDLALFKEVVESFRVGLG